MVSMRAESTAESDVRTTGFVQISRHAPAAKHSGDIDEWVKISVPLDHVVLIGFLFVVYPLPRCVVALYTEGKSAQNKAWDTKRHMPSVAAFDTAAVFVRFSATRYVPGINFRLLYTFHQYSLRPSHLTSGRWNCSVPEWPEFRRHFLCNLKRECEAGEDEGQCPYTGRCGQDHVTLAARCYKYISDRVPRAWLEANLECKRQGGYLVSLNTPGEWQAVVTTLKKRKATRDVFVGLKETSSVVAFRYKNSNTWADRTIAYFAQLHWIPASSDDICGQFTSGYYEHIDRQIRCRAKLLHKDILCELDSLSVSLEEGSRAGHSIEMPVPRNQTVFPQTVDCPGAHFTHDFLACDLDTECWSSRRYGNSESETTWGVPSRTSCPAASMVSLPAMFPCRSGLQRVPYSLVCDHRRQCADGSDEDFCVFRPCSSRTPMRCGSSSQCVSLAVLCDGQPDCWHGVDELQCSLGMDKITNQFVLTSPPPPAVIHFKLFTPDSNRQILYDVTPMPRSGDCPETHFQCPANGYCLPVFLRCNGVNDCPGREDEAGCDRPSCPGLYRCRGSKVCLHPSHVCDGRYQCSGQDDEMLCQLACPVGCTCHGLAFTCHQPLPPAERHPEMRYLDASGSGLTPDAMSDNTLLIHLSLSRCGLTGLAYNITFPNVHSLDLSYNKLDTVSAGYFCGMPNIQRISLSTNPLRSVFLPDTKQHIMRTLRMLDLSGVKIPTLVTNHLSLFPGVRTLNLSHCDIKHVAGDGLGLLTQLRVVDIEGCPLTRFPSHLLSGLNELHSVLADNFKVCCPDTLPSGFNLARCRAPRDEVSSCLDLLRADSYRVIMCIFCSLALFGNLGCFLVRRFLIKGSSVSPFGVFVSHLSLSDFLMGVYLSIIGVADRLYEGSYLWHDIGWRYSVACKMAGFLSMLSNEVSAFFICLITLDRFLVLRFPFSSLHFKTRSAHVACAVAWAVAVIIAAIPLMPVTSHWSFYSQTGICIPLPVTRGNFKGHHYAFCVFIVLNFLLFLFIAAGQAAIYFSIRANSLSTADTTKKSKDLRIARRLISVAVSDFLCWFPIGLLGLLASRGVPVPGEVNVSMAILVLPLNSALNPFIYTVNVLTERRQKSRDKKFVNLFIAQMSDI